MDIRALFTNRWFKMGVYGFLGMTAGFAYYYFIGCNGGTCPITSNPYISTGYGLGAGLLIGWEGSRKKEK